MIDIEDILTEKKMDQERDKLTEKEYEKYLWDCVDMQREYCTEHTIPMFMPSSGRCNRCGCDIRDWYQNTLREYYITGCPRCHSTFCD